MRRSGSGLLINLASNEYFKAARASEISAEVVTPVFKDLRGDKYKVISFFAKKARGQMARFIIEREINDAAGLKKFRAGGYRYNRAESQAHEMVFTRDAAP